MKLKGKEKSLNKADLVTINGVNKTSGFTSLKIKIFEIEKNADVYIMDQENFKYDFLIGLVIIKSFKLIQNEDLEITQKEYKKYKHLVGHCNWHAKILVCQLTNHSGDLRATIW